MSNLIRDSRRRAIPSVIVCCLLSSGCVPEVSRKVELSATQAALKAQMAETARLEREVMEAEARRRLPEDNPHEPATETEVPAGIAVDDPAGLVERTDESVTDQEEEPSTVDVASEADLAEEDSAAVETALAILDVDAGGRGAVGGAGIVGDAVGGAEDRREADSWPKTARAGVGAIAPAAADTLLVTASLDRIARAIEQQNLLGIMEARLEDKQRSIDALRALVQPRGAMLEGGQSGVVESADARLEQQVRSLTESQRALTAAVQALREAQEAADGQASADAEVESATAGDADRRAAEEEREAREQARWGALMKRIEAIEAAGHASSGDAATGAPVQSSSPSSVAADEPDRSSVAADEDGRGGGGRATGRSTAVDDSRVAELQARLARLEAEQAERDRTLAEEAEEQGQRHREERAAVAAELEARYAALAEMQAKALKALEEEHRRQRRWWQVWRGRGGDGARSEGGDASAVDIAAEIERVKEENRREWEELLARQEAERAALEEERAAAAAQRAALEARVEELSARLQAAETAGRAIDPADLQRLDALAASVEQLSARTETLDERARELEARTLAREQRIRVRLQPIIDAGLKVTITDGRARIHLPGDVLFASGSATLGANGRATVDSIAEVLKSAPDLKLQVEGHTDNVPVTGGGRTNWDLGFARARAVLDRLIADGIPAERISAASFGDTRPIASNDTPEGRALNRRIELVVLLDD